MNTRIEIPQEDLTQILEAVLHYNGYGPENTQFFNEAGEQVKVHAVVKCGLPGLKIRIAPEDTYSDRLQRMTSDLLNKVQEGNKEGNES